MTISENVLEYGSFDGFGGGCPGVSNRFADNELASASILHKMDDAFAVDANQLDSVVVAAGGRTAIGDPAVTCRMA